MTQITLPITGRTSSDDNTFQDVYSNDNAIATVVNSQLQNDNLAANAAIAHSKLANSTAGHLLIANASGVITGTALSGDATVSATGVVTVSGTADNVIGEEEITTAFAQKLGVSEASTVRRGKSIIATEEGRTNVAYGTLATPDQVSNVVLPADGLIVVAYQALFKSSVNNAGSAAIFIGANQLKRRNATLPDPIVDEADTAGTNNYTALATVGEGLDGGTPVTAATSDVTTGQVIGIGTDSGGPVTIFAAAGTYTISVQFKASSGSVTAKERKLWIWTLGF